MLYLIATPIGNLQDISFRALETLKICDYILCEDTRHSRILLQHYEINKPLVSFHKFSEASKESEVLDDLKKGLNIALISDAGTPGIADPGTRLVQKCHELELPVSAVPGPCAAVMALTLSGFDTDRFQFIGFLPRKNEELREALLEIFNYPGTSVAYESPQRLIDTLLAVKAIDSKKEVAIARELTKKFEQIQKGSVDELLAFWQSHEVKGELVLIFSGNSKAPIDWTKLTPEDHVALMQKDYSLTRQEAIRMVAQLRGVPKRTIYNQLIKS